MSVFSLRVLAVVVPGQGELAGPLRAGVGAVLDHVVVVLVALHAHALKKSNFF